MIVWTRCLLADVRHAAHCYNVFLCMCPDLLSGVYHWGVDNYGDGNTPVFGSQIAGFQVWTRSTSAQHEVSALPVLSAWSQCLQRNVSVSI